MTEVEASSLLESTGTRSCGCIHREMVGEMGKANEIHGNSRGGLGWGTREYRSWQAMKQRCTNPNHHAYPRYGGVGITICQRWLNSFENFLADMGPRPSAHTLDRINPHGNYSPGNCRWATYREQALNRRR